MLPRTLKGENAYRFKKRRLEIEIIIYQVKKYLSKKSKVNSSLLEILEFGCGIGFQIPYLQKLGAVTATDISIPKNLNKKKQAKFIECDISNSPFYKDQFDLIFSNHVIEHVRDLNKAFDELKRIGKKKCLYALSVPTNVWLLLSIPAQYLQKLRAVVQQLNYSVKKKHPSEQNKVKKYDFSKSVNHTIFSKVFDKIKPHGHGSIRNFWKCYQSFKKNAWLDLFQKHGFKVVLTQPLLIYAPSEWPIIPILSVRESGDICSSLLFLIEQR